MERIEWSRFQVLKRRVYQGTETSVSPRAISEVAMKPRSHRPVSCVQGLGFRVEGLGFRVEG